MIQGIHYYLEDGKVVYTHKYHLERGYCCGSKCRHCPFDPPYIKKNTKVKSSGT